MGFVEVQAMFDAGPKIRGGSRETLERIDTAARRWQHHHYFSLHISAFLSPFALPCCQGKCGMNLKDQVAECESQMWRDHRRDLGPWAAEAEVTYLGHGMIECRSVAIRHAAHFMHFM